MDMGTVMEFARQTAADGLVFDEFVHDILWRGAKLRLQASSQLTEIVIHITTIYNRSLESLSPNHAPYLVLDPKVYCSIDSFYYLINCADVDQAAYLFKTGFKRLQFVLMSASKDDPNAGEGIIMVLQQLKLLSFVHQHPRKATLILILPKGDSQTKHNRRQEMKMKLSIWSVTDTIGANPFLNRQANSKRNAVNELFNVEAIRRHSNVNEQTLLLHTMYWPLYRSIHGSYSIHESRFCGCGVEAPTFTKVWQAFGFDMYLINT